jgi:hypothetical protein
VRIRGLTATAASRAWLGVAAVGLILVVLVVALSLIPRLGAGQRVIDAAKPAFTDERVAGTRAGVEHLSRYVDLADPLMTARGGGSKDAASLVSLMRRRMDLSTAQVRKVLRREVPHIEALTRALPLDGVAAEVSRLTAYLAATLSISVEQLAAIIEQDYPRIAQMLTALPNVADAWYDVPGIEGLTRVRGDQPVRTVPGLGAYVRDDVVARMVEHREHFHDLAGSGRLGTIPFLLLALGLGLLAYGVTQARRAATTAPGRSSWRIVAGTGVLVVAVVVVGQYFPRLGGGQKLVTDFEPVFAQERVKGMANGIDSLHEAIELGDPIATARGGAAREAPRLYRFVAQRTGTTTRSVRRALRRRAPRTVALLDAIPLTEVAAEAPRLVRYLARGLGMPRARVQRMLRRRTPRLAQALLIAPAVTGGWNAIPATERLTRFDGVTPVRTTPEFDAYLRQDLVPVLVDEREDFERLAGGWPPLGVFAPLLTVVGLLLIAYGAVMMRRAGRR